MTVTYFRWGKSQDFQSVLSVQRHKQMSTSGLFGRLEHFEPFEPFERFERFELFEPFERFERFERSMSTSLK